MLALVDIAGVQFEVQPADIVKVPKLHGEIGDAVQFTEILLCKDENNTVVGTPKIAGTVSAKILEHGKDAKVIVFKKKRRKGYRKLNGHRQQFTKIEITDINIQ